MCGTGRGLLKFYVFKSLFLRTTSNISARIPLPTRFFLASLGRATFSPGEGLRLTPLNDNFPSKCKFFSTELANL